VAALDPGQIRNDLSQDEASTMVVNGAASVVAADIADPSLAVAKALGADELRNLAAGDTLPEDAELVFEASGAPAALGGVPVAAYGAGAGRCLFTHLLSSQH
jgi:threonine dehydrogenase-like Zn-dependent dehydrogenase